MGTKENPLLGRSTIIKSKTTNYTFALMLSPRQLIAVCSMSLSVVWLIAALAYVAGHAKTAELPANLGMARVEPMVIDPVLWTGSVNAAGPGPKVHVSRPAAVTSAEPVTVEPLKGQRFWQVRVVDRTVASVYVEFLNRLGLQSQAASSTDPSKLRILVGPLNDDAEKEALRKAIEQAGLPTYLRKF